MRDRFQEFIQGGLRRSGPQWLILAFIYVQHHENAAHGQLMNLKPLMMTHRRLLDTLSFNAIVAEADYLDDRWELLLLGCMDDAPEATVQRQLHDIARKLASGESLSDFLILDRQEHCVVFDARAQSG